jgi:transposase InsO family protein
VLVFIAHGRRELVHVNVTASPTAAWVRRQPIEATPWGRKPRDLLRDRDAGYGRDFRRRARRIGIDAIATPIYAPKANATGQMLSIAIAFPLVLSRIPQEVMVKLFVYGGGMGDVPQALQAFEQGVHQAFLVSFGITLVAALASALRPAHSPRGLAAQQAAAASVRASGPA